MASSTSAESSVFLVLIETASNQKTVFRTNRLRENIGGSELIRRVGTRYVLKAICRGGIGDDPDRLSEFLLDPRRNPPIEGRDDPAFVEILIATSGKALLLTRSEEKAKRLIAAVTWRAANEAPGVPVRGAYVSVPEWPSGTKDEAAKFHEAMRKVHHRIEAMASKLPSPDLRFPRLPFVEECRSSGLPAERIDRRSLDQAAVSRPVFAKRACRKQAWKRIGSALSGVKLYDRIDRLEEEGFNWLAIVHADGNGLGEIFLNFAERSGAKTAREYIERYRRFSLAIDYCARKAAVDAIKATWPANERSRAPVAPVVLGGDDLTVICEGSRSVAFAARYLQDFERWSVSELPSPLGTIIATITRSADLPGGLSAAAGIAVVKPHFPFHRAYELAEDLATSAKKAKEKVRTSAADPNDMGRPYPCSALDFQVIFDTSGGDLAPIRKRMETPDGDSLTARPYVVTPLGRFPETTQGLGWARARRYEAEADVCSLRRASEALKRRSSDSDDRDFLPRSQQHALHDALFMGVEIADGRLNAIRHRYEAFDWGALLTDSDSLFFEVDKDPGARTVVGKVDRSQPTAATEQPTNTKRVRLTYLLDALELADLESEDGTA